MIKVIGVMAVERTLEIQANEALKSEKLRSESPIVLPSLSVMTNLVAELPDVDPADCPEVRGTMESGK